MAQEFDPAGPSPDRPHDDAAELFDDAPPPLKPPAPATLATPPPKPPSRPAEPPRHSPFPVIMGLLMIATLAGSWFISRETAKSTAAAPAPEAKGEVTDKPAPPPAPAEDPKALKGDVDALAKRIDAIQAKLDGMPKAGAAADLKPLEEKVAHLAKVPDMVAPLPKKLDDLNGRIGSIGKELDGLKAEVAALKKAPEPAATTPTPAPADVDVAGQAMGQAVDLFKKGKYKEAADAFRKLAQDEGNDARVWYYAALANGLATRNWTGETADLVKKGMEREKAGSPATDKIDAVFTDLTTKTGKDWLAGYRKLAR